MNCKQGELAVIVLPYEDTRMRGIPVTVHHLAIVGERVTAKNGDGSHMVSGFGPAWVCEGSDAGLPCVIADECLKPLRDPGEDAKDETLNWLPVPHKEIA